MIVVFPTLKEVIALLSLIIVCLNAVTCRAYVHCPLKAVFCNCPHLEKWLLIRPHLVKWLLIASYKCDQLCSLHTYKKGFDARHLI